MSDAEEKNAPGGTGSGGSDPSQPDPDKILKMLEAEMQLSRERRLAAEKKQKSSMGLISMLIGFLFFLIAASFVADGLKDALKQQVSPQVPIASPTPGPTGRPR